MENSALKNNIFLEMMKYPGEPKGVCTEIKQDDSVGRRKIKQKYENAGGGEEQMHIFSL